MMIKFNKINKKYYYKMKDFQISTNKMKEFF